MKIRVYPISDNHVRVDLRPNLVEFLVFGHVFEERYAMRARAVGRAWEWVYEKTGETCPWRVQREINRALRRKRIIELAQCGVIDRERFDALMRSV